MRAAADIGEKDTRQWWKLPKDGAFAAICAVTMALVQHDQERLESYELYASLYNDESSDLYAERGYVRDRLMRTDVTSNAVDTLHARIVKNRPRPWPVTSDGDQDDFDRAKGLEIWLDGEFERDDVYELTSDVVHDALIYGTGAIYTFEQDGRPYSERVFCGDLFVEPREEQARCVRTLYYVRGVDREVLAEAFPKAADAIKNAARYAPPRETGNALDDIASDLVMVIESWRLPPAKGKPGRHCIITDKGTLLDEPWTRSTFPMSFIKASRDPKRFWGIGIVRRMAGIQSELNELTRVISESYHLMVPSVWLNTDTKVFAQEIDNTVYRTYRYQGGPPPIFMSPPAIAQDFVAREQALIQRALELRGISPYDAMSIKPAGLDSGRAQLVHQDIQTERFAVLARAWEKLHVDIADQRIACAEDIIAADPKAELVVLGGRKQLESINFGDVRLADDTYVLRVYPVSALSATPEGKIQNVSDLVALGVITDPNDIRELLDFPDLERFNSLASAGRDLCDKLIADALRGKSIKLSNTYMPLDYFVKRGLMERDLASRRGATDRSLANLEAHITWAQTLLDQVAAAAALQAQAQLTGPANGPPPGAPPAPVPPPIAPPPIAA